MRKLIMISPIFILIITGCSPNVNITQVHTPSLLDGGLSTPLATENVNTPPPYPTSTVTYTLSDETMLVNEHINANLSQQIMDLNLKGSIWVRLNWEQGKYLRIDLGGKADNIYSLKAEGCFKLLPNSTKAVCILSDQTFLLDFVTGVRQLLPVSIACWDAPSSNGRLLAFEECKPSNTTSEAVVLNLDTQTTHPIATFSQDRENRPWNTEPILSMDGKYLIIQSGVGIIEISGKESYEQISSKDIKATWDMAWSPTENLLLYGATDIETDIGYVTNHLILQDVDHNESKLLFKAHENSSIRSFLNQEVWSPDGNQIAVLTENNGSLSTDLCIIAVDNGKADCQPIVDGGKKISNPAWSPDSKYLVFEQEERSTNFVSIVVYTIEKKAFYTLYSFYPSESFYHDLSIQRVFWRSP